tara:strand:- start:35250 stop:35549 length:300 start_codon:yes stop_codon:yes gene_type:complete
MRWIGKLFNWGVVQSAERVAVNHEVAGSSPAAPAIITKGENMTVSNNTKQLKEAKQEITKLRLRINELVDELASLKSDVRQFKSTVAEDVKYLTNRLDG